MKTAKNKSSFSIIIIAICLSLIGIALAMLLPMHLRPQHKTQSITATFWCGGKDVRIMEATMTREVEASLASIEGVMNISSYTADDYGQVTLDISDDANVDQVRLNVSQILRQLWQTNEYPGYPNIRVNMSDEASVHPFYAFSIQSQDKSRAQIISEVHTPIIRALSQVKGIRKIDISSPVDTVLNYTYSSRHLAAINSNANNLKSEYYDKGQSTNIGNWTLRVTDTITTNQLITNRYELREQTTDYRVFGQNTITVRITANPNANIIDLRNEIEQKIETLKTTLSDDLGFSLLYDNSKELEEQLHDTFIRSAITLFILLLFVWIASCDVAYAVTISLGLIFNICISFIFYYLVGIHIEIYSISGITISLSLMIDNLIVMLDHIRREESLHIIRPIAAATLTTIGALGVVFMLEDQSLKMNMTDFAIVIIINLAVSFFVALYIIPALWHLLNKTARKPTLLGVRISSINSTISSFCIRTYEKSVSRLVSIRAIIVIAIIIAFGLPIYMIPEQIQEPENILEEWYNSTLGSKLYQQHIRPYTDPILGGTLRLFTETNRKFLTAERGTKRTLNIRATFAYGTTALTVNNTIRRMEEALRPYHSLMTLMETNISDNRYATITAEFPEKLAKGGRLAYIQNEIESRAASIGNAQWNITGLTENVFSNELWEQAGDYQIKLTGYDYDRMLNLSDSIRASLLSHNRIKSVEINSHFDYYKNDNIRYTLRPEPELLSFYGISPYQFRLAIKDLLSDALDMDINDVKSRIISIETQQYDIWQLMNSEFDFGGHTLRLGDIATIKANGRPSTIQRYNQEYTICLQYTYIGTSYLGSQITDEIVKEERKKLPLGYALDWRIGQGKWWSEKDKNYWAEAIWVLSMLLTISLITLGNVRRSLEVIFSLIPTFIGSFISLAISETPYGQGALAGFVLLAGICVNSAIYTLCQEDNIKSRQQLLYPNTHTWTLALSQKMAPILLTSLSTLLGFIPILWNDNGNHLWHDMAIVLIGGLPASVIGLWLIGLFRSRLAIKR